MIRTPLKIHEKTESKKKDGERNQTLFEKRQTTEPRGDPLAGNTLRTSEKKIKWKKED